MLLTILTRTFFGRPRGLMRCISSVMGAAGSDVVQHILVAEEEPSSVGESFVNLRYAIPKIRGEYVMLLDDDDYILDGSFFLKLSEHVQHNDKPSVVIVQMQMSPELVLPEQLGGAPVESHIPCSSFIVRKDIFEKYIESFRNAYDGDYQFIRDVWDGCERFTYLPCIATQMGGASHGKSEHSSLCAVFTKAHTTSAVSGDSGKQSSVGAPVGLPLSKQFRH